VKPIGGIAAAVGIALLPAVAGAEEYIEARGGSLFIADAESSGSPDAAQAISDAEIFFDQGWTAGFALGADVADIVRLEIEYTHRRADVKDVTGLIANPTPPPTQIPFAGTISGTVAADSVMLNVYKDIPFGESVFGSYFGLGAGGSFVETDFDGIENLKTRFAYQAMAGLSIRASSRVTFTAGYNYFVVDNVPFGNGKIDIATQGLIVGLRFSY
jgi:opacity protein-like surface antigen